MQLLTHSPFLGVSTRVVLQHQPLPKELKLLYTLPISLIWSTAGLAFSVTPTLKAWGLTWSLSCCFLPGTPSGAILTGCCVERIFFYISCCLAGQRDIVWTISLLIYSGACCCSGPHLKLYFQDTWYERVYNQTDLEYAFSKNPQCKRKLVFPFC